MEYWRHYIERAAVWDVVRELVHSVMRGLPDLVGWWPWLLGGVLLLLLLPFLARGHSAAAAPPARQWTTATVRCECGRTWTVRT